MKQVHVGEGIAVITIVVHCFVLLFVEFHFFLYEVMLQFILSKL